MKIRFIQSVAGLNFSYGQGSVTEISDQEARSFIRCGVASPDNSIDKLIAKDPEKKKEYYWKLLDAKKISYKKSFGVKKLKELIA